MSRAAPAQISSWAHDGGWADVTDRITATAVALAEGADPAQPNGLWGVGGPADDGLGQARHAFAAWQSQGWGAFPAHRSGRWRLYLPIATAAVPVETIIDQGSSVVDRLNPLPTLGRTLEIVAAPERLVKIIVGLGMIMVGAFMLTKQTMDVAMGKVFEVDEAINFGVDTAKNLAGRRIP